MSAPVISFERVSHRYGDHPALREVTFGVAAGSLHALLGPNGSGKTTLFRILTTLLRPTGGTASIAGADVIEEPAVARKHFGVVFQHPALDEQLTITENLRVQAALYGLPTAEARSRADDLLRSLGLDALASRFVRTLSGGERRRADLARALVHRPDVLLLDEPTTALDPTARRQFHDLLARLRKAEGVTILMATHLLDEADDANAVTILHEGRVVADGTPDDLKSALGDETLWITPVRGSALDAGPIPTLAGATITRTGERLHVTHARPAEALARLSASFPDAISSATVRRPTLDDVFFAATGADFGEVGG